MPKYDVFLNHNSQDRPAVEELARRLVKEGIQPWLDKWNLIPGEPWQEAIEEALSNCATCAVFIGPSGTGPWQNEEMRAAIDRRVSESGGRFRVIPVLLPGAERGERSQLPIFLVATTWVEFRRTLDDEDTFHRLVCGIRGMEPGPGPGQAVYKGICPYRGLRVFDVEHAPFFLGREALTEWLLNELHGDNRFLAIIGPSGSGKSSLARAGLVAALKQGQIKGSADWPIAICRPGPNPLESLAVALGDATGIGQSPSATRDLIRDLRDDESMLHLTTRLALRNVPTEQRLALLVDQFEEMFTLCRDESQRKAFIDNLFYAASVAEGQTIVLLALRADFYGKCAAYPALAAALSDHQLLVGPMSAQELRRAIEQPAQLAGCEFEPGLVERLLREVKDQPGGLPLLQHALLELWGRRRGRWLTHTAYEAIGGVEGALERRAEAVYKRFSESERAICRRVFLRLTQPGEGTDDTKRRATLQELMPAEGEREVVEAVVRTLASEEARLVTTKGGKELTGEQFVEVAHEALIRGWWRLRKWIDESREFLHIHRRLTEAASEWEENNHDESFLYRGARLAEAEKWAEAHASGLNILEHEFLRASIDTREREYKERELQRQREMEAARVRETLSRYMGPRVVEHVLSSTPEILSRHERRQAVVMFAGLRGATDLIERPDPNTVASLLNEFYTRMTDTVYGYDGTVFELAGDRLMVGFNVLFDQPDAPNRALLAAIAMQRRVDQLCQDWLTRLPVGPLGVGIASGEVVLAAIGGETHMNFTMLGNTVSIARWLESAASPGQVLISEEFCQALGGTQAHLPQILSFKPWRSVRFKGKAKPVAVYKVQFVRAPIK